MYKNCFHDRETIFDGNTMIFETDRLVVGKLSYTDLDNFYKLHGDAEIMGKIPAPVLSFAESKAKLCSIVESYVVEGHRLRIWGAYLKGTGQFVGLCAAIALSEQGRDIGYRILKEYWGQGLGTELTGGLIRYLRQSTSLAFLTAAVDRENTASIKILEKYMTFVQENYDPDTDRCERYYKVIF